MNYIVKFLRSASDYQDFIHQNRDIILGDVSILEKEDLIMVTYYRN